jgi:hypothetical protein
MFTAEIALPKTANMRSPTVKLRGDLRFWDTPGRPWVGSTPAEAMIVSSAPSSVEQQAIGGIGLFHVQ